VIAFYMASKVGDLQVSQTDIRYAQKPDTLGAKLNRVWDHITDWFLGTNYVQAKDNLAVLYNAEASPREKAESFFKLKALVAPAYQDRFVVTIEPFGYSLEIKYGGGLEPYSFSVQICDPVRLTKTLNDYTRWSITDATERAKYEKALQKDFGRSSYRLRSEPIRFTDKEPPLTTFGEAIGNIPGNEKQKQAAIAIASQKLFALLIYSSCEVLDPSQLMHFGGKGETSFNFFSDKKGGVIMHARSTTQWQSDIKGSELRRQLEAIAGPQSPMLLAPVYDTQILIDSDGKATVLSAVIGIDPVRK